MADFYIRNMATAARHDWYLRQWLATLRTTQADLERRTGWDKRKASHLVTGKQPYKRETVNEAALALNVEPFELLMHPDDAFALRQLREAGLRIAAEPRDPFRHEEPVGDSGRLAPRRAG
ncbi:MAG: helix-turn-helix transcriptional regulator [Pseudomonas graminis]